MASRISTILDLNLDELAQSTRMKDLVLRRISSVSPHLPVSCSWAVGVVQDIVPLDTHLLVTPLVPPLITRSTLTRRRRMEHVDPNVLPDDLQEFTQNIHMKLPQKSQEADHEDKRVRGAFVSLQEDDQASYRVYYCLVFIDIYMYIFASLFPCPIYFNSFFSFLSLLIFPLSNSPESAPQAGWSAAPAWPASALDETSGSGRHSVSQT